MSSGFLTHAVIRVLDALAQRVLALLIVRMLSTPSRRYLALRGCASSMETLGGASQEQVVEVIQIKIFGGPP